MKLIAGVIASIINLLLTKAGKITDAVTKMMLKSFYLQENGMQRLFRYRALIKYFTYEWIVHITFLIFTILSTVIGGKLSAGVCMIYSIIYIILLGYRVFNSDKYITIIMSGIIRVVSCYCSYDLIGIIMSNYEESHEVLVVSLVFLIISVITFVIEYLLYVLSCAYTNHRYKVEKKQTISMRDGCVILNYNGRSIEKLDFKKSYLCIKRDSNNRLYVYTYKEYGGKLEKENSYELVKPRIKSKRNKKMHGNYSNNKIITDLVIGGTKINLSNVHKYII